MFPIDKWTKPNTKHSHTNSLHANWTSLHFNTLICPWPTLSPHFLCLYSLPNKQIPIFFPNYSSWNHYCFPLYVSFASSIVLPKHCWPDEISFSEKATVQPLRISHLLHAATWTMWSSNISQHYLQLLALLPASCTLIWHLQFFLMSHPAISYNFFCYVHPRARLGHLPATLATIMLKYCGKNMTYIPLYSRSVFCIAPLNRAS